MDENYLHNCFALTGEVSSYEFSVHWFRIVVKKVKTIKVIRNKQTGQPEGYGFVEFFSHATAEKVLQTYNGNMPNTDQLFRLNWATFSMGDKRTDGGPDRSIFVGDLASDVTDSLLFETFASKYPSVKGAKVVMDAATGRSKGYGFVRFGDDNERSSAVTEMNGRTLLHLSIFFTALCHHPYTTPNKPCDTATFIASYVSIVTFSIVTFFAMLYTCRKSRGDPSNQWNGSYYGGQMYDGYGYAAPAPQDPNMYAAAAYGGAAYPVYGNHQQQVS
ncbi:hypothetical protein Sjap_022380 [Stephania japonica]|uniref:RRM domain-containing protein n=1 Tax=Stephania japonica TaxID=461633 RepID=A0AAP0HPU2_9MAGN